MKVEYSEAPVSFDEDRALRFDWFAGDFGELGDRQFGNQIVTSRGGRMCCNCRRDDARGERVRVFSMRYQDGDFQSYRFCSLCCAAANLAGDDGGEAIEIRTALGNERIRAEARR